ncbi:MAG: Dabb family protein, partial [Flavisolibacter sp.]
MKAGNRRQFILTAAAAGAGILAGNMTGRNESLIIHHVFFWLKDPTPANQQLLLEGIAGLKKIKQVKKLYAGVPASTEKREVVENSYHVSELLFFADLKG